MAKTFSSLLYSLLKHLGSFRGLIAFVLFFSPLLVGAESATLFVSPAQGDFNVGETFTVSVFLDSGGSFINAVEANLTFPPDKIQVVSPSIGKSFIDIWVGQPQYSNIDGTVSFRGAVPSPGINVSQGLISTITFRVKSVGTAVIKFADTSKVLLNDGKGTNILSNTRGAIYNLALPPPAGPVVVSATHANQDKWYPTNTATFSWASERDGATGYSYTLDREPISVPDNVSEGLKESVSYSSVSDGVSFFHIKALRGSIWGGITHYGIKVDVTPPAAFNIEIEPRAQTASTKPVISFQTTDAHSGISHYEIKIVPLSTVPAVEAAHEDQDFFIEVHSPYIPELARGKYDVIVRAYDNAGNFREISKRLVIGSFVATVGVFLGDGWLWIILILVLLLTVSFLYYHHYRDLHKKVHDRHATGVLSSEEITRRIKELQDLQAKYAKAVAVILILASSFLFADPALAQNIAAEPLPAPFVTTYQEHTTNDEIFYVGGKHNILESEITIFVQNEETGERFEFLTKTDGRGDWFYSHDQFLSPGGYQMWAQARVGEIESPPSAQVSFEVSPAVIRLGASRISFEAIYLLVAVILLIAVIVILILGLVHRRELRRKHRILVNEVREAEESIRRGFALLKRDIEDELRLIKNIKISRELAAEEVAKEKVLLDDLTRVESEIGKEVWDIKLKS